MPSFKNVHAELTARNLQCARRAEMLDAQTTPAVPPAAGTLVLTDRRRSKGPGNLSGINIRVHRAALCMDRLCGSVSKNDRWIARYADGHWQIQQMRNVGSTIICRMCLCDPSTDFPHHSGEIWEEYVGKFKVGTCVTQGFGPQR